MFFERPKSGESAILVHLDIYNSQESEDPREFELLVLSAGGDPVDFVRAKCSSPQPRYFIGAGKLEELKVSVNAHNAELVIFNHNLSPSQERNLEAELNCRVLDRTGLILDIFAQRARTHEGKLQVELAQLQHMSTRLVRGWTHLERQKGGIGLRGPGETQLETDRRLLRVRIRSIEKRLEKVRSQREQGRRARRRAQLPTLSLVGYTNAGKSTLFNAITDASVFAEDQLFATLDPTMRRIRVQGLGAAVLADTVGFISHLPHRLVEAFRATLEEASSSELLLHVIDAADEERHRNIEQVDSVLGEIGAADIPQLKIYNKIDLLDDMKPRIDRDDDGRPLAVWVSAHRSQGLELIYDAVSELLGSQRIRDTLYLEPAQSRLRARLYDRQAVTHEEFADNGEIVLALDIEKTDLLQILSQENLVFDSLHWQQSHNI